MLLFKVKAKKNAVRQPVKRRTREEIEADFERIQKTLDEIAQSQKRQDLGHEKAKEEIESIRQLHRKTEKTLDEIALAHKQTEKAIYKAFGDLTNTMGLLIEHIMRPDLPRKFRQFGFTFDRVTIVKWTSEKGNIYTEIDGLLENGKKAMVVEIKTTLRRKDVDDHLERMERVRLYADNHGDSREFLGAMAGAIIDEDTKRYTLSKGFFVIEPSGENVQITKPDKDPKIW